MDIFWVSLLAHIALLIWIVYKSSGIEMNDISCKLSYLKEQGMLRAMIASFIIVFLFLINYFFYKYYDCYVFFELARLGIVVFMFIVIKYFWPGNKKEEQIYVLTLLMCLCIACSTVLLLYQKVDMMIKTLALPLMIGVIIQVVILIKEALKSRVTSRFKMVYPCIFLYITIGMSFSALYSLDSNILIYPTSNPKEPIQYVTSAKDQMYFSFVTLATTGYGDIQPKGWGKLLVIIENIMGVFIISVLLGSIVGLKEKPNILEEYKQICDEMQEAGIPRELINDSNSLLTKIENWDSTKND